MTATDLPCSDRSSGHAVECSTVPPKSSMPGTSGFLALENRPVAATTNVAEVWMISSPWAISSSHREVSSLYAIDLTSWENLIRSCTSKSRAVSVMYFRTSGPWAKYSLHGYRLTKPNWYVELMVSTRMSG